MSAEPTPASTGAPAATGSGGALGAAGAEATTGSPAPPKARIALWDNARFVLIVLVVVGHTISTVRTDSEFGFALYAYIYLFHMPAMILLSGLFSKPEVSPKAVRSTVQLLAVWLIWEGIWALIHLFVEGRGPGPGFLVAPAWTLWFLVTLVTMRIALPYIARLRHPLLFSIAVALIAGLSPAIGTDFSASRTLCFLPFFVAGWLIRDRGWLDGAWFMTPAPAARVAGWGILAAVAAAFVLLPQLRETWRIDRWLTWRDGYDWLFAHAPIGDWEPTTWAAISAGGIAVAAGLLVVAAMMTFAILLVVPRGHSVITVWGSRTLFVYLLHGPIVWVLRETGVVGGISSLGHGGLALLVAIGTLLAALLSMTWVTRVFKPIIEPPIDWALARISR